MSGELVMRVDFVAHEDGQLEVGVDSELSKGEIRSLLELALEQLVPADRAEEAGSFGYARHARSAR